MLSTNVSIEQKIDLPEFREKGVNVFIKRDDLIHPFISGNKWRKLKYNHKAFLESGCKGIATFGGAFSNHIIATAAFCAENRIECIGIIRGEEPKGNNPVLTLAKIWGMNLEYVSREDYRDKNSITNHWVSKGYLVIPEGGENEAGVKGCEEIISELSQSYNHILCASGTGTTFAGIVKGVYKANLTTLCHSIPVLKNGEFLRTSIDHYLGHSGEYVVHTNYHFGGYAKTTPELFAFLKRFATKTGILSDPVYTAKMLYALTDLIKTGYFKNGESILAIHTGGLLGLMSEKMLNHVQNSIE